MLEVERKSDLSWHRTALEIVLPVQPVVWYLLVGSLVLEPSRLGVIGDDAPVLKLSYP